MPINSAVARTARAFAALAALTLASLPVAAAPAKSPEVKSRAYANALVAESKSQQLCEADQSRIFVRHKLGTACIAYFATKGHEEQRRAIVFFDGDVSSEHYADQVALAAENVKRQKTAQSNADRLKVRYVVVSRLGVDGSSGNHGNRRKPDELIAMNAALEILKKRLGFDEVVLAGQSGGATIAASMLTLGRTDVRCAVLGSGAYALVELVWNNIERTGGRITRAAVDRTVYDPSTKVEGIKTAPDRRIFVLADEADTRTPYDQQLAFTKDIARKGHHARLAPIVATGEHHHGATLYTLPVAAMCARDIGDGAIATAVERMRANVERLTAKKVSAVPTGANAAAAK